MNQTGNQGRVADSSPVLLIKKLFYIYVFSVTSVPHFLAFLALLAFQELKCNAGNAAFPPAKNFSVPYYCMIRYCISPDSTDILILERWERWERWNARILQKKFFLHFLRYPCLTGSNYPGSSGWIPTPMSNARNQAGGLPGRT